MRPGLGTGLATVLLCLRRSSALLRPGGSMTPPARRSSQRARAAPPLAAAAPKRRRSGGAAAAAPGPATTILPIPVGTKKAPRKSTATRRTRGEGDGSGAAPATAAPSAAAGDSDLLFTLEDLVAGTLLARPSRRNRSPYVADLRLEEAGPDGGSPPREALVHLPNLDMCGQCGPGAALRVRPLRDAAGRAVGPDAVSAKYGTPRCEFAAQLLRVDHPAALEGGAATTTAPGAARATTTWVAAHPSLGERVAEAWLRRGLVLPDLPPAVEVRRQVTVPCGDGGAMRPDFLTLHEDGTRCLVEVKTVVDVDYARLEDVPATFKPKRNLLAVREPYVRSAIFPNGSVKQKGPDGEAVVSSRAIKHLQELTRIVQQSRDVWNRSDKSVDKYEALVLFCVVRGDAEAFRPNHVACPSFAKYLKEARDQGVRIVAKRTCWDETGRCFSDKDLPIQWPE